MKSMIKKQLSLTWAASNIRRNAVVVLLLVLAALLIHANLPSPARAADSTSTTTTARSTPGPAVLTDENLEKTLEDMGLEPKKLSKGYLIVVKQDTWTLNTQLVLSENKTKLGMNSNLGVVEEEKVTASQWMSLLVSNGDIDPSSFYYNKEQKKLYLHRSIDNRDLTPAILRKEIETFCSNVRSTSKLWEFTK